MKTLSAEGRLKAVEGVVEAVLANGHAVIEQGSRAVEQAVEHGKAVFHDRLANFRRASKFTFWWTKREPLIERLAALYYWVQIFTGLWAYLLCFYLTYRYAWRFLIFFIPYELYIFGPGLRAAHEGNWPTPLRGFFMWRLLARYFKAQLHKTADLDPSKPYIFCAHPHGVMPASAWLTFATWATGFDRVYPGIEPHILTLGFNFHGPAIREYLLLHGVCDVSRSTCINLLSKGKSIAIEIGGGTESLYTAPGTHDIVLNRRKGFIKIALRTGASLVPVYCFGETDSYSTLNRLPFNSPIRRFQRRMEKACGWTWPIAWGTGVFLPIGVLPYPAALNTVIGAPIEVPKYTGDLGSAEFRALVDKYHAKYVQALTALFNDNKEKYAKGEGDLTIVE